VLCSELCSGPCFAAFFSHGGSKITLRKRLHVNTLITEPGTMEVDWNNLYSLSTMSYIMPSAIRYTPEGPTIPWGRTEYSLAFDPVRSANVTLTAVSVLRDGEKLDLALAPQVTFFTRDDSGARLGAIAIARYDSGRNSSGVTFSWSAATRSSPTNPAGTFDVGFGFGRQLSRMEKLTPHMNVEWERSTGQPSALLAFEGVEYQVTERLAFDLSAQHFAASGSAPDHQLAFTMTLNLGHVK
jgi:hypothetical protein